MKTLLEEFSGYFTVLGPKLILATGIFALFWLAAAVVRRMFRRLAQGVEPDRRDVVQLLGKTVKVGLIVIGAISALGTLGINVTAMVAGLGLTGFALGFALKDALSNFLAGVLVLIYRPFARGDVITVAGFEGEVQRIDLRYTTLEADGARVLIPNSVLFTNTIKVQDNNKPA